MPIPELDARGLLPEGIHPCSMSEIAQRFGRFQRSDRRCRLFERLIRVPDSSLPAQTSI